MTQHRFALFCLIAVTFLLAGCPALVTAPPAEVPAPTPGVEAAPTATSATPGKPALGQPFTLGYGQTATLEEIGMAITFQEVVQDSRCPADVTCAWSGVVNVHLLLETPGEPPRQMLLGGVTDQEGQVLGPVVEASGPTTGWHAGHVIALQQVTPYPLHHDDLPPPEAYAVTLLVTPAQPSDRPPTPTSAAAMPIPTDPAGLPLLCVSERVLVMRLAGASDASPAQLTSPVAAATLFDTDIAEDLCEALFGDGFEPAEIDDLGDRWDEFLPAGAVYWLWTESGPVSAPE
jgi:hypothetical protein